MKINWKSIGAAAITTLGVIASAGAAGAYGSKFGPIFALVGMVFQAVSHPVATKAEGN